MSTRGIHHITAVAGDPKQNHRFYTQVLGLRLVKKTVNFDDPSVYHLYYGNETGDPGTILTFFPWSHLQNGKPDAGQVVAVAFSAPTQSVDFWTDHLKNKRVDIEEPFERFGKQVLGLQDPDGLHLEIVFDPRADEVSGWSGGPLPTGHTLRGIHGATFAEEQYAGIGRLLEEDLGFELTNKLDNRYLYETNAQFGGVVEVIDQFELQGRPGKGTVHHIAFRCKDEDDQQALQGKLRGKGYHVTEVKDRDYFRSVYFHEPGGILCEIATDPPGFGIDESQEELGSALQLPEELEQHRHNIERELPKLND